MNITEENISREHCHDFAVERRRKDDAVLSQVNTIRFAGRSFWIMGKHFAFGLSYHY